MEGTPSQAEANGPAPTFDCAQGNRDTSAHNGDCQSQQDPGGNGHEGSSAIALLASLGAEPRQPQPVMLLPNPTQRNRDRNGNQSHWSRTTRDSRNRHNKPFPPSGQRPAHLQRGNVTMGRYHPHPVGPTPLLADWDQFRSVLLTLRGVPRDATTWDLHNSLSPIGNIAYIAIEEDRRGERSSEVAIVRFEPPPVDIIQIGTRIQINVGQRNVLITVDNAVPTRNEGACRSPLGQNVSAKIVLKPTKLSFGITMEPNIVMAMKSIHSIGQPGDFTLTMDFARRRLTLNFPVLIKDSEHLELDTYECQYRMETRFDALHKMYRVSNDNMKAVVVALDSPPRFYRKKNNVEQTHASGKLNWGEHELWSRVVDIRHHAKDSLAWPASLENNQSEIDLGRWTTYWFELDTKAQDDWVIIESALKDWNIKTKHDDTFKLVPKAQPQLWSWLENTPVTPGNTALTLLASAPRISLPFDVRYQLEVCISHGVFEERNITLDFLHKLADLADTTTMSSNRARLVLEYAADQGKRIWNPMSLFDDRGAMTFYPTTAHIPHYCALVRKVTVTPTRIYFHSPAVETTNRVIRHFKQEEHFFLRVQFIDELNEGRINGSDTIRDNELYIRAFRVMNNGIKMGRWHWNFLAFGNSQIRENGAFFFCEPVDAPEGSLTCDKIRAWMGRFSHIKVAAKYAARLGQCFSTTRLLRGIPAPTIVNIPDVERNGHCYTDGVGKMSPLLAQMITEDWQLDTVPSACQFRMGGCKGVLVTWPEAKGIEVHIRKSQEKFHSEFNGLEIIRFSNFSVATLNRQTITILSCLGVPDEVFVGLLQQQLGNYNRAMKDRAFAVHLLQQYVDENQVTVGIARMLLDGFMETREPFVMAMMQLWRSWSIKGLKEKARIVVDDGAFVIGCIDETRTLKGQVEKKRRRDARVVDELPEIFIQISNPKDRGSPRVITGVCLVGRNPSLHPGDIRVVKAVNIPALRHLKDVVVFPMQGDQDLPSMCSGGDLDGDDYFVIWNQDMIPTQWYQPPMDYTPPPPLELDRDPNVMDLKIFFSLYMKNNSLPIIAHAHLAQADFMDSGAKDPRCVELAKLHSKAVDYVKTGVPAIVDRKLLPQGYPHFMEKKGKKAYHSGRVLGQLYDKVHHVNFTPDYKMPFDDRILKRYKLSTELLKKARHIKSQYDTAMRRIMGQMEIRTEFEVLSTFVMTKPKVGTAYKLHEIVSRESEALRTQFKDICIKEAGGTREYKQLAPFVAAMYQVTSEEVRIALHEARTPHIRKDGAQGLRQIKPESMPLISFPWLFDGILGRIAKDSMGTRVSEEQSDVSKTEMADTATPQNRASRMDHETMGNMEYARTNDGRVVHRGQILRLFHLDDEDREENVEIRSHNPDSQTGRTFDVDAEQDDRSSKAPSTVLEPIITAPDEPITASRAYAAASEKSSSTMSKTCSIQAGMACDLMPARPPGSVGQHINRKTVGPLNIDDHCASTTTSTQTNIIKSHIVTEPTAGLTGSLADLDELDDLIDLTVSPRKAKCSTPERMKCIRPTQSLDTIGPKLSDENLMLEYQSAATSPTLCDPIDTLDGDTVEDSPLDSDKVSEVEAEYEIEEVMLDTKAQPSALEYLAKLS